MVLNKNFAIRIHISIQKLVCVNEKLQIGFISTLWVQHVDL